MDPAVKAYIEAIPAEHRPLFERVQQLVVERYPDAEVGLSYKMPVFRRGRKRLFVGAWQHGISLYGWGQGAAAAFVERHPELKSSKGTIQLRPQDALIDEELTELIRAALD